MMVFKLFGMNYRMGRGEGGRLQMEQPKTLESHSQNRLIGPRQCLLEAKFTKPQSEEIGSRDFFKKEMLRPRS